MYCGVVDVLGELFNKDLKNSLLATCFIRDASNSLSPYLGKIISLLLIGQLKNPSMVPNK